MNRRQAIARLVALPLVPAAALQTGCAAGIAHCEASRLTLCNAELFYRLEHGSKLVILAADAINDYIRGQLSSPSGFLFYDPESHDTTVR